MQLSQFGRRQSFFPVAGVTTINGSSKNFCSYKGCYKFFVLVKCLKIFNQPVKGGTARNPVFRIHIHRIRIQQKISIRILDISLHYLKKIKIMLLQVFIIKRSQLKDRML